jgi:ribosomal protein S18 acetylase RimI-like enzyme
VNASLELRALTAADLPFAAALRALVGWNQTLDDWRRFLAMQPDGCFLARWHGRPAGTATTLIYGPDLAWIGMVLVHPDYRRRRIGRALLTHCITSLQGRGVRCIKLDATPAGKEVYRGLGFKDEWTLARWEHERIEVAPPTEEGLRPWRASDAELVEDIDSAAFGLSRGRLLRALTSNCQRGLVLEAAPGRLAGFGLLRPGARALYLGPVAAASNGDGLRLVGALLAGSPGARVFWDIPEQNTGAVAWARQAGFTQQRPLTRMYLGENVARGDPRRQFALAGPEVG